MRKLFDLHSLHGYSKGLTTTFWFNDIAGRFSFQQHTIWNRCTQALCTLPKKLSISCSEPTRIQMKIMIFCFTYWLYVLKHIYHPLLLCYLKLRLMLTKSKGHSLLLISLMFHSFLIYFYRIQESYVALSKAIHPFSCSLTRRNSSATARWLIWCPPPGGRVSVRDIIGREG